MKEVDPGHEYLLDSYDGEQVNRLVFMKREGEGYPFNVGHHPGTNCQEVWRASIARIGYLQKQKPCTENVTAIIKLRELIWLFETRAARRHERSLPPFQVDIEVLPTCAGCGHIGCEGNHKARDTAVTPPETPSDAAMRAAEEVVKLTHSHDIDGGTKRITAEVAAIITRYFAAVPVGQEWLPIKTAPRDSSWILGLTQSRRQVVVRWGGGTWEDDNRLCRDPLMWQPLPAAPNAAATPLPETPPNHALFQLLNSALLHPETAEGNIRQVIETLSVAPVVATDDVEGDARTERLKAQLEGVMNSLALSQQEVERLRAGRFTPEEFQNLCHGFDENDKEAFIAGCLEYQKKLFGSSRAAALRTNVEGEK